MGYNGKYSGPEMDNLLDKISKDNVGVIDYEITAESENPVTSAAIYAALEGKATNAQMTATNERIDTVEQGLATTNETMASNQTALQNAIAENKAQAENDLKAAKDELTESISTTKTDLETQITQLNNNKAEKTELEKTNTKVSTLEETAAEHAEQLNTLEKDKANTEGYYPNLHVGLSDNLPDRGDILEGEISFRESAGADNSIEDGTANVQELLGNSVVWNQICGNIRFSYLFDGTKSDSTYDLTTKQIAQYGDIGISDTSPIFNNKYLISVNIQTNEIPTAIYFNAMPKDISKVSLGISAGKTGLYEKIVNATEQDGLRWNMMVLGGCEAGYRLKFSYLKIVNLTQMFGSGNEPATVEEFYARCPVGVDLYAYNEGEVINVNPIGIKSVNDNAFNGEYAKVLGGREYCVDGAITSLSFADEIGGTTEAITLTDNKYTPSRNGYIYATGTDICIHLVHSGYKDHIYTPHEEYTMPINIKEYFPSGMCGIGSVRDSVTKDKAVRRFDIINLASLTWYYSETYQRFSCNIPKHAIGNANIICAKYATGNENFPQNNKEITSSSTAEAVYVKDTSYTDAATFKAAMSGVLLYYELAEPVETDINPQLNLSYKVWDFGTEELIPDGVSAPVITRTIYGFNATDTIRNNKFKNEEQDARLKEIERNKVDYNDYAPQLTAGYSDNLVSKDIEVDSDFSVRQSGGGAISDGVARVSEVRGNSVVWNQIIKNGNFVDISEWTKASNVDISIVNNILTATCNEEVSGLGYIDQHFKSIAVENNMYALIAECKASSVGIDCVVLIAGDKTGTHKTSSINWETVYIPLVYNEKEYAIARLKCAQTGVTYQYRRVRLVNLTQMFGAGNEPTTIEDFYARCPQNIDLNVYNEGELINMNIDSVKSTGRNIWDEVAVVGTISTTTGQDVSSTSVLKTKEYIPIPSKAKLIINIPKKTSSVSAGTIYYYDVNKLFIGIAYPNILEMFIAPSNARYCRVVFASAYGTTYNNDICINLADPGFNGQYEPYKAVEKTLPPQIKEVFPDGMKSAGSVSDVVYNKDGKGYIEQRIGVVDMGSLSWIKGNTFIYALAPKDMAPSAAGVCIKYPVYASGQGEGRMLLRPTSEGDFMVDYIGVIDSSYTDAASFKTAMQGVMLYYELAEPIITEYDEPFNLDYLVTNGGQEIALATLPSSNLKASIQYGFNAAGKIKENSSRIEQLEAMVTQLTSQLAAL